MTHACFQPTASAVARGVAAPLLSPSFSPQHFVVPLSSRAHTTAASDEASTLRTGPVRPGTANGAECTSLRRRDRELDDVGEALDDEEIAGMRAVGVGALVGAPARHGPVDMDGAHAVAATVDLLDALQARDAHRHRVDHRSIDAPERADDPAAVAGDRRVLEERTRSDGAQRERASRRSRDHHNRATRRHPTTCRHPPSAAPVIVESPPGTGAPSTFPPLPLHASDAAARSPEITLLLERRSDRGACVAARCTARTCWQASRSVGKQGTSGIATTACWIAGAPGRAFCRSHGASSAEREHRAARPGAQEERPGGADAIAAGSSAVSECSGSCSRAQT